MTCVLVVKSNNCCACMFLGLMIIGVCLPWAVAVSAGDEEWACGHLQLEEATLVSALLRYSF